MDKFLLDSNVIIDYLRCDQNVSMNLDKMIDSGVTANTKHFGRIENLKMVNWREYELRN